MHHSTLILGDFDRASVDVLARDGRATPRYGVHTPHEGDVGRAADRGWTGIAIADRPFAVWRADDMDALTRLVEALSRAPSLVCVSPDAVPAVLGFLAAAQVPAQLRRRGGRLSLVLGADEGDDISSLLVPLARSGVADVVAIWPGRPHARSVAPLVLDPRLRRAVDAGRARLPECLFDPCQSFASKFEMRRSAAVEVMRESVERVSAFRAAVWGGDDSPMGCHLVAQANELRIYEGDSARTTARSADSRGGQPASARGGRAGAAEADPSPRADDRDGAEVREMVLARIAQAASGRAVRIASPKVLEAVAARSQAADQPGVDRVTVRALVPYRDARTGVESLAALDPTVADGLSPPRRLASDDRGRPGFFARVMRVVSTAASAKWRVP